MIYKNKCIKILALLFVSFNLIEAMEIEKTALFVPNRLGNISVHYDDNGFNVKKDTKSTHIQPWFIDKELRGISKEKLSRLIAAGAYLSVNSISENEYSLKLNGRLNGGGVGGAWLGSTLGYGLVTFAGHGIILAASCLAGPAQPAAFITLEKMFSIPIHSAACAAGVAGGVAAGVATGPL